MNGPRSLLYVVLLVGYMTGCLQENTNPTLDEKKLPANVGFYMKNNLAGTILQSSDPGSMNETMTFINLDTYTPQVYFPKTGITVPYMKSFESDETLTLVFISSIGSIDSFVIDKRSGKYSRVSTGNMSGLYLQSSLGICR